MGTVRQHRAVKDPAHSAARAIVAPPVVVAAVHRAGTPLKPAVRREFEHHLGHDFSAVRIHSDGEATRATAVLGARAYTLGRHIAIKEGLYDSSTTEGRRLLTHELTHVAQQAAFHDHQLVGAPVLGADHPSERQARAGDGAATSLAEPAVQCDSPDAAAPPIDWDALRPDLIKYLQRLRRDHPGQLLYLLFELKATGLLWPALKSMTLQRYMTSSFEFKTDEGLLSEFDRAFPTRVADLPISLPRQTSMGPAEPGVRYPTMSPWEEYQQKMSATRSANFNLLPALILELSGRDGGQYLVDTAPQAQALAAIGGAPGAASVQPRLQPSRPSVTTTLKSLEPGAVATRQSTTIPPSRPPASAPPARLPQRAANDPVVRSDTTIQGRVPPGGGMGSGGASGPIPASPLAGAMRMNVRQGQTIVDADTLIALDKATQPGIKPGDISRGEAEVIRLMQGRDVIATPTSLGQFKAAGARGTVPVARSVRHTPAQRQAVLRDLETANVGTAKGAADREVVADALLAQTTPNVVPVFATSDPGVINGLFRLSGGNPARLGGYNVTEYLLYTRGEREFRIKVQNHELIVRPLQPVRPRR